MSRSAAGTIATCEYSPTGAATPGGLRNSAVCRRLDRSGHVRLDLLEEALLRHVADEPLRFLAALEQDHRRDGADAEAARGDRVGVDIELRDPDVLLLGCDLLEDRGDHPAGAAPGRPEIDQHRSVRLEDLLLECL